MSRLLIVSLEVSSVFIFVLTAVASIGWGLLFGLSERVGSIRKLFELTSSKPWTTTPKPRIER